MDVVTGGWLFDAQCDLVGAYDYAIRLGTALEMGSAQLRALGELQREHRHHAALLQRADLLPERPSDPRASLVVARALVRFVTPRGWTAVLEILAEQERQLCAELVQLWVCERASSHVELLHAMIMTSRCAIDWLTVRSRTAA